jgi:hypothetical protein
MSSKPLLGLLRPFLLAFGLLPLTLLPGCAGKPPLPMGLKIPVAQSLREPCPRPEAEFVTVGDLAAFTVRQEAAISICDARRGAAVATIDAANAMQAQFAKALKPKPWWHIWP